MGMKGGKVRTPAHNLPADTKAEFQRRIRETLDQTRRDPVFSSPVFLEEPVSTSA
jgi:hypothetical protein